MKTDSQLYLNIEEKLTFRLGIDFTRVDVTVHSGVVTILGMVNSSIEKHLIKCIIQEIDGVKAIADKVFVKAVDASNIPILLKSKEEYHEESRK